MRKDASFRDRVTADGSSIFPAEPGRYHLYVSLACPWAHRTLIMRQLKGLEDVISDQSHALYHERRLKQEASELLDWALSKLSAADKMVFELVYLEGRSGKEAADFLGWSVANVKVRSFRCRKKIKKLLSEFMAS